MAASMPGKPVMRTLTKLPGDSALKTKASKSVTEHVTDAAVWTYAKAGEWAGPAASTAKNVAWFAFCAGALLAIPMLIEVQREAMLAVEKEQMASQVEDLQRQLAAARDNQSIATTIGALVGSGGDAAAQTSA